LLDREAPGLVHLALSPSLQHTPLAALSRPIAGTRKNTLIITLPGSVKAVREILATLFTQDIVGHALELIKGGTGSNRHAKLADSLGQPEHSHHQHHHQHHHHSTHSHQIPKPKSNDPSAPGKCQSEISDRLGVKNTYFILVVSARSRHSPYPLISFEGAIELIDQNIKPLEIHKIAVCIFLILSRLIISLKAYRSILIFVIIFSLRTFMLPKMSL